MKGFIIAIISLALVFLVFLPMLHMGGKISLKEYYEGVTNWVPEKTPEGYTVRNIQKVQEDLRVAPKAERLLILERKVQSGQKLSDAEMEEAENLRKDIEKIRRVDQKWLGVGKKIKSIEKRIIGDELRLSDGFLEFNSQFNNPKKPTTRVVMEPGRYEVAARGLINIDRRYTNRPDLLVSPAGKPNLSSACNFPFPEFTPCSLVMQPMYGREAIAQEIGDGREIIFEKEMTVEFTMNDCELQDNGGEGWTVAIRKLN